MVKIELLAPAGSLEKLKYAIYYGADAVYAGVPDFSLRVRINNFNKDTLKEAVKYAHKYKKKIYITLNIYAHNRHLAEVEKHLQFLKSLNVDGVVVSDPGVLNLVKKYLPKTDIHLSTQANTTNWQAAKFWFDLGVKRIVLAREVTLEEIKEIKKRVPKLELEYFVHGAMCMSYSGRCILSKWMAGRSANLGDCAQPCRWLYSQKSQITNFKNQINSKSKLQKPKNKIYSMTVEDARGEYEIDLEEDRNGTYFFNSKDLNLLNYLDELQKAGVDSFKIEGRNKSVYYLATVVRAYRKVIDILENKISTTSSYRKKLLTSAVKKGQQDLNDLMHRGYTTGFLFQDGPEHNFQNSHEASLYEFVGEILGSEKRNAKGKNIIKIKVHNAIYKTDKIEIITPEKNIPVKIIKILNADKEEVASAHGGHGGGYYLEVDKKDIEPMSLIRKKT